MHDTTLIKEPYPGSMHENNNSNSGGSGLEQILHNIMAGNDDSHLSEAYEENLEDAAQQSPMNHMDQHNFDRDSVSQNSSGDEDEEEAEECDGEKPMETTDIAEATTSSSSAPPPSLVEELGSIKNNIVFLNHQIGRLMDAMNVSFCPCSVCKSTGGRCEQMQKSAKEDQIKQLLSKLAAKGTIKEESNETNRFNGDKALPVNSTSTNGGTADVLSQLIQQTGGNFSSLQSLMNLHSNPARRGRKSKYCSPAEKKAVADYAQIHGASAAARKFNIPPPVAAYYHRKEYKSQPRLVRGPPTQVFANIRQGLEGNGGNVESPGTTSGDDMESANGEGQSVPTNMPSLQPATTVNNVHMTLPSTPNSSSTNNAFVAPNGSAEMFRMDVKNAAHSTGSPGFLRGRGRGRPKLIGDELDAELVEYMVRVKEYNPRGHLTASQALDIARAYILEKAPGLLEEHGGHIKLKLTWAMKLVSRISERQKEIQLGLPAGSLQNMTKSPTVTNSGYMGDMTQNMFNQQVNNLMNHMNNTAPHMSEASSTPEIVNVRELKLPMNDHCSGENTGEIAVSPTSELANSELLKNLLNNLKAEDFQDTFGHDPMTDEIPNARTTSAF